MTRPTTRFVFAIFAGALAGVSAMSTGCRDRKEERTDVSFHVKGVMRRVEGVRHIVNNPPISDPQGRRPGSPHQAMRMATDELERALYGLPERIEKKAASRVEERKAAAEKAMEKFKELRPTLESLKYDKPEMNARLDELAALVRQAEQE